MTASRKILFWILVVLLLSAAARTQGPGDLLAQGRIDEAIASLEAKVKKAPDDAASYNLLCRAYFALEDWNRGISACEKGVSLSPENSQYHLWLGRIYGEKA